MFIKLVMKKYIYIHLGIEKLRVGGEAPTGRKTIRTLPTTNVIKYTSRAS